MEDKNPLHWEIERKKEEAIGKKTKMKIKGGNSYLLLAAFSFAIIGAALLSFWMVVEKQLFSLSGFIFLIPPLFISFLILYFFYSFGLKILKIEEISKYKVINYILIISTVSLLVAPILSVFLKSVSNQYITYLFSFLSFLINLFIVKYYLGLSGKKLWLFILYSVILSILISIVNKLLNRF